MMLSLCRQQLTKTVSLPPAGLLFWNDDHKNASSCETKENNAGRYTTYIKMEEYFSRL